MEQRLSSLPKCIARLRVGVDIGGRGEAEGVLLGSVAVLGDEPVVGCSFREMPMRNGPSGWAVYLDRGRRLNPAVGQAGYGELRSAED